MKVHQLIKRDTWCKGTKHTRDGKSCAIGWIERVYGKNTTKEFKDAYLKLRQTIGHRGVVPWNDNSDYPEVYTAFKKADI